MKPKPLVEVTWRDAAHYYRGAWTTEADAVKPVIAVTVGYLLRRNRKEIVIAQTYSTDLEQWGGLWVIPASWTTRIRRLK